MELTPLHREIAETIGEHGATSERLLRHGREFNELSAAGLVVFWPRDAPRPTNIHGAGLAPDRWYLTIAAADALGLAPPALRLR